MQTWISITDTLPKEKEFVLVACASAKGNWKRIPVTAYHYEGGKFKTVNWYSADNATGITHWMPLPRENCFDRTKESTP